MAPEGDLPRPGIPGSEEEKRATGLYNESQRRRNEAQERVYSDRERGGAYPMEGEYYYNLLRDIEVGEGGDVSELADVLERVKAYQEGLLDRSSSFLVDFDPDDPNNPETRRALAYLRNLFLTVEGSSKRPNAPYVLIQEKQSVEVPLIEAEAYRQNTEGYKKRRLKELNSINEARILRGDTPISEEALSGIISKDEARLANEYFARKQLLGIANHAEARDTIDYAFRQRMATCENPDAAAKLGGEIRAVTPDGATWESFFHTEGFSSFGEKVDAIFEEIVKFGLSESKVRELGLSPIPQEVRRKVNRSNEVGAVYADGFKDSTAFAHWMKYLINKADGRLDVVWSAWRLALTWEVPEQLGIYVDKGDKNKYVLSAPPIGNSLLSQTIHTSEKRKHEFGWTSENKRYQTEKFVGHSGLPLTFEVFPRLCEDYLHQTKVEIGQDYLDLESEYKDKMVQALTNIKNRLPRNSGDVDYDKRRTTRQIEDLEKFLERRKNSDGKYEVGKVKVSLWELRMYGGLKFSDPHFPWLISDQPSKDEAEPGELPSGAFGFWLLTRSRASEVYKDAKSIIPLQDLTKPDFFISKLRNWVKVMGPVKDAPEGNRDYIPPQDNPRAVWILAQMLYYNPGEVGTVHQITQSNKDLQLRSSSAALNLERKVPGYDAKGASWGDVLFNAAECGFIREVDKKWILDKAGFKLQR